MVRPLDESQGPSPLQGHGSWLMCEVALSMEDRGVHHPDKISEDSIPSRALLNKMHARRPISATGLCSHTAAGESKVPLDATRTSPSSAPRQIKQTSHPAIAYKLRAPRIV